MKCSLCGEESEGMLTMFNIATMTPTFLCSKCQAREAVKKIKTIKKVDAQIQEFEELAANYERMISQVPEMPDVPEALAAFAMTPLTAYKGVQYYLAELRARRMEIITQKDSVERLEYELKKSLESEDYEKSAQIRDALNKKKVAK